MALTSALVVGGVYTARTSHTRARLARSATDLRSTVERALVDLVAAWDTAGRAAMAVGAVAVELPATADSVPVTAWITRLNEHTYWMVAEAASPDAHHVRSRLGLLVRSANGRIRPVSGPAWTRLP